jgi:hypothetical protein
VLETLTASVPFPVFQMAALLLVWFALVGLFLLPRLFAVISSALQPQTSSQKRQ